MFRDPIVEEVRQIRRKIESECEDDGQKYYEHIRKMQEKHRERLVRREPRPALKKEKAAI
jgi:hypothetical protein